MSKLIDVPGSPKSIQQFPSGSLKTFGTNPYGEAIFRVVWSESRYYLVGANHVDYDESAGGYSNDKTVRSRKKDPNLIRRETGYRWLPLYPNLKAWVLECWKSPIAFTGCTREQYTNRYSDPEARLLTLGPYPSRGEFVQCFTFPSTPSVEVIHNSIYRVKAGWNYTYGEHKAAIEENELKKEKQKFALLKDVREDRRQAFKDRPSNIRPGKRKKEDIKLRYSAEDLRLHKRGFSSRLVPY